MQSIPPAPNAISKSILQEMHQSSETGAEHYRLLASRPPSKARAAPPPIPSASARRARIRSPPQSRRASRSRARPTMLLVRALFCFFCLNTAASCALPKTSNWTPVPARPVISLRHLDPFCSHQAPSHNATPSQTTPTRPDFSTHSNRDR